MSHRSGHRRQSGGCDAEAQKFSSFRSSGSSSAPAPGWHYSDCIPAIWI